MVLKWLAQNHTKRVEFLYQHSVRYDYALVEAHTTYGRLGIKVWIMKGEVYGKRELSPLVECLKNLNQILIQELEIIVKEDVNKIIRKDVTTKKTKFRKARRDV